MMAVVKDKERGTWRVSTYYKDWTGKQCKKTKRGFKTKHEAQDWEKEFLEKSGSVFGEEHSESKELKSLKAENERLPKKVGQLTIEVDFFAEACEAAGLRKR